MLHSNDTLLLLLQINVKWHRFAQRDVTIPVTCATIHHIMEPATNGTARHYRSAITRRHPHIFQRITSFLLRQKGHIVQLTISDNVAVVNGVVIHIFNVEQFVFLKTINDNKNTMYMVFVGIILYCFRSTFFQLGSVQLHLLNTC